MKPIIFSAFANDKVDYTRYLRNLPLEHQELQRALEVDIMNENYYFTLIPKANLTVEQFEEVFLDKKTTDKIQIFHYGGHAEEDALLLEDYQKANQRIEGKGFVAFLKNAKENFQKNLHLVFLNACQTQHLAQQIADFVPVVIGTSHKVEDSVAAHFSIRFYYALTQGHSIKTAFEFAKNDQSLYRKEETHSWQIFYREEHFLDWKLYQNPFQKQELPAVSSQDLEKLDWTQCLRPQQSKEIAYHLLCKREAINLIGLKGTGRRRMAEDLKNVLENLPFVKVAIININEYAQNFEGFRLQMARLLATSKELSIDQIVDEASQQHYVVLFLNGFERIFEEPKTLDNYFDKIFLDQLNGLRNTNRAFLVCATEKTHKDYLFRGQGSWLHLENHELWQLSQAELQNELQRQLPQLDKKTSRYLLTQLETRIKAYEIMGELQKRNPRTLNLETLKKILYEHR